MPPPPTDAGDYIGSDLFVFSYVRLYVRESVHPSVRLFTFVSAE